MPKINLHPINYILIPISAIISILLSNTISQYLSIFIISSLPILLSHRSLNYKILIFFLLSLIPGLIGYFLASLNFNNYSWDTNATLITRITCLSSISFIYIIHLNHEQLLIELMQRKIISISMGFALLATNNALVSLKQEFVKIQLNSQLRYGKRILSPKIILPLLVAASRYAHNISISLYSRGINQNRSFLREKIRYNATNWLIIFLIISLNIITTFIPKIG